MTATTATRDPIAFELFKNSLFSIADEMALTITRTTYSGVLKDNMDFSTAFADADGRLVAQGLTLPGHLGSIPTALEATMRHYGDAIAPGDLFIMNDPFDGGMHLPDIFVFQPLFVEGQRLAFAATVCHHTDVGGRVAGSNASDSTEIYAEGIRIPPLKMYEAGKRNDTLFALIEKNVRIPVKVFGDLRAQLAACHIAETQFLDLVHKYGVDTVQDYMRGVVDYAERLTRAAIRKLPDGVYSFEDWIDDDGIDVGVPIRLFVTFTKAGDQLNADWTGTSPQVKGAINNTLSFTKAATYCAVRSILPEGIPNNEGLSRHGRHRPARYDCQCGVAGRLCGPWLDRFSHGGLLLWRTGQDGAGSGVCGVGWRQYRYFDWRLRRRAQAVYLRRFHLRHVGRAAVCRWSRRQFEHVRQHGVGFG